MIYFAMTDTDGLIKYVVEPTNPEDYTDGGTYGDYTARRIDSIESTSTIMNSWYWDTAQNQWAVRSPNPNTTYYDWNTTTNQWDFNPTACASYFLNELTAIKDAWILSNWSESTQKELAATAAFLLNEGKNSTTHCSEFKPFLDYYVNNENAKSSLQIIYDAAIANITNPATSESVRQSSITNALTAYYNDVNSYDPDLTTCP